MTVTRADRLEQLYRLFMLLTSLPKTSPRRPEIEKQIRELAERINKEGHNA